MVRLLSVAVTLLAISSCSLFATSTEVAHDWVLTGVESRTLQLSVAVGSSSCDNFERVEVSETATEVEIRAVVAVREAGSGFLGAGCTADLGLETVVVTLDQPLGDRILTGCAPGEGGLEDYFDEIPGGRTTDDCAEIVEGG